MIAACIAAFLGFWFGFLVASAFIISSKRR